MELVRMFFLALNAIQAVEPTREAITMFTAAQAIELLQLYFPELDAPQVIGPVRRIECPAFQTVMKGLFRKEPTMKKVKIRVDRQEVEIDVPEDINAPGLSGRLSEPIAVIGLRGGGGSRVPGELSVRGLANVAVLDVLDDFMFILVDHRYLCRSSVTQFLSSRVSKVHWTDVTISELRLEVEDGHGLFSSVLEATKGGSIAVDSAQRRSFVAVCAAMWNSELYQSFYPELGDKVTIENVTDCLQFL
jgi:hypothetical protein